ADGQVHRHDARARSPGDDRQGRARAGRGAGDRETQGCLPDGGRRRGLPRRAGDQGGQGGRVRGPRDGGDLRVHRARHAGDRGGRFRGQQRPHARPAALAREDRPRRPARTAVLSLGSRRVAEQAPEAGKRCSTKARLFSTAALALRTPAARRRGMERNDSESGRARVPLKTVLASIAGLWLCYFVLTTLRSEILGFGFPFEMMWRRALACLAGIGITVMLWLILRLFDARPQWMKIIAALVLSVPAAVLLVQSNAMAFADIQAAAAQNMAAGQQGEWADDPLTSGTVPEAAGPQDTPDVVVQ